VLKLLRCLLTSLNLLLNSRISSLTFLQLSTNSPSSPSSLSSSCTTSNMLDSSLASMRANSKRSSPPSLEGSVEVFPLKRSSWIPHPSRRQLSAKLCRSQSSSTRDPSTLINSPTSIAVSEKPRLKSLNSSRECCPSLLKRIRLSDLSAKFPRPTRLSVQLCLV